MATVTWGDWNAGTMTSSSFAGAIAHPFKGFSPSGKIRKGEIYGKVYPTTDAAYSAMMERGYVQTYRRGPSAFIRLRLPRRLRTECIRRPGDALRLIRAAVPESDRQFVDGCGVGLSSVCTPLYLHPKA